MRILTAVFGLLAAGSAAAALWPFSHMPQPPAGLETPGETADAAPVAQIPAPAPLATLTATRERPIFFATRRPVVQAPLIPLDDAARDLLLGRYAKTGVVLLPDRRIVLLRDTVTAASLRIGEGEMLDGWRIVEVGLDGLMLEKDGERMTFAFGD